jgi:hypothetical protein
MKYSTLLLFLGLLVLNDNVELVAADTIVEDMGEEDPSGQANAGSKSKSRPKMSPEEVTKRKKAKKL